MVRRLMIRPIVLFVMLTCGFGCSSHLGSLVAGVPNGSFAPYVQQQQGSGPWIAFPIPDSPTFGITPGPDGNVWYCDEAANALRRVDMSGALTSFSAPDHGSCSSVTTGPDKNLYFGETDTTLNESGIARMTTSGGYTFYPAIQNTSQNAWAITTGGDGHVWALANGYLWRLNSDGSVTAFQGFYGGFDSELVTGTDGNLWTYKSHNPSVLIRITLDGSETEIPVPKIWGIAAGNDGGMWFGEGDQMARIDPTTLAITTYPIPRSVHPYSMTLGRANILYFIDTKPSPAELGVYNIRTHKLLGSEALPNNQFSKLTVGPDYNVWIGEKQRLQVDAFVVDTLSTSPTIVNLLVGQSTGLSATEKYASGQLAATSTDTSIATITSNGTKSWTVTAISSGTCSITVFDAKGNSVDVPVTVN